MQHGQWLTNAVYFVIAGGDTVKFERYSDFDDFAKDTYEVLSENEVQNNLLLSFIESKTADRANWISAAVKDNSGEVVLTAVCTPPYNIVMYETGNKPNDAAVKLLADELRNSGESLPGVLAEEGLAGRFAEAYGGKGRFVKHMSMNIMRLDKVNDIELASGSLRTMREEDMFFVPYWERAFSVDCNVEVFDIPTTAEKVRKRIGKDIHFIWEDGHPVSQAAHARNTQNGAVINSVYTPPFYRNKGYASSVVAMLSQRLLQQNYKFCCLFADTSNPVSCGIYRKIGFFDVCVFGEVRFLSRHGATR